MLNHRQIGIRVFIIMPLTWLRHARMNHVEGIMLLIICFWVMEETPMPVSVFSYLVLQSMLADLPRQCLVIVWHL